MARGLLQPFHQIMPSRRARSSMPLSCATLKSKRQFENCLSSCSTRTPSWITPIPRSTNRRACLTLVYVDPPGSGFAMRTVSAIGFDWGKAVVCHTQITSCDSGAYRKVTQTTEQRTTTNDLPINVTRSREARNYKKTKQGRNVCFRCDAGGLKPAGRPATRMARRGASRS